MYSSLSPRLAAGSRCRRLGAQSAGTRLLHHHEGTRAAWEQERRGGGAAQKQQQPQPYHQVVFVRHGQSTWNKANRFIGWTDTALTEDGLEEAREAGRILHQNRIDVNEVHTSLLQRCTKTAYLILAEMGKQDLPVHCHWRLNERSYGALVGKNKKECVKIHGVDQVKAWRRSYDIRPPAMDHGSIYHPRHDPAKYRHLPTHEIPAAESLKDTKLRATKYWNDVLVPSIKAGNRLLIVGHENNLRSLLMHIDDISREDVLKLEIPRAVPIVYHFDEEMRPIRQEGAAKYLSGKYLLPEEQLAAIQERDHRQVYDTSIKVNLEELALQEALALIGTQGAATTATTSTTAKRQKLQHRASQLLSSLQQTLRSGSGGGASHHHQHHSGGKTGGGSSTPQRAVGQRALNMLASQQVPPSEAEA